MARRSTPLAVLAAAAALALVLGACSSDDGDDASAEETTTTTVATDATDVTDGGSGSAGGTLERYADYETVSYDDPTHWVCRPDLDDDICDGSLDATRIGADGTTTVEPFERADDPPIDCFYVYPTISRDEGQFADWNLSPDEEGFVTLQQAARLQSQCRLFAPGYRQLTLGGLGSRLNDGANAEQGDPFGDVLDAFKTYMAEDNDGRGIVLIGHSQGGSMLNQLLQSEFDPNEDVRDLLVGAYLAGSAVAVPEGEVVGGDLAEIPLCQEAGEAGCVTTWASFRDTAPPPANSFFGAPRQGDGEAGCVNPAAPGGRAELDSYFPADADSSILDTLGANSDADRTWLPADADPIETPFVHVDDLATGECATEGNFNYLEVEVTGAGDGPRADDFGGDLSPEWGLHLVDVNLVMGDIVTNVEQQAAAWAEG